MYCTNLTLSLPESIIETCSVVLNFECVDEILWCDHSNETSSTLPSSGTSFLFFNILQNEIWDFSLILIQLFQLTLLDESSKPRLRQSIMGSCK